MLFDGDEVGTSKVVGEKVTLVDCEGLKLATSGEGVKEAVGWVVDTG